MVNILEYNQRIEYEGLDQICSAYNQFGHRSEQCSQNIAMTTPFRTHQNWPKPKLVYFIRRRLIKVTYMVHGCWFNHKRRFLLVGNKKYGRGTNSDKELTSTTDPKKIGASIAGQEGQTSRPRRQGHVISAVTA